MIILCTLLTAVMLFVIVILQGDVSGTEFAPSHFETREFSFYEIPFVHWQITPVRRKNTTDAASRQIRTSGYITSPRGKPPQYWHLVRISRGPSQTPALASLLADELSISDGSGAFWKTWNQSFPNRAAALWPIVQRLAERELYVLIPELLQLARSQSGGDDGIVLQAAADFWLVDQYIALISDMRDAGRGELADGLLQEALADYPEDPALMELSETETAKVPGSFEDEETSLPADSAG